jgi:hypothetical protein
MGRFRVVSAQLGVATMTVGMAVTQLVHFLVLDLGSFGGTGRAGDVGDRRDVVPVDAVAQPEDQGGQQQGEGSGIGHRGIMRCGPIHG